MSFKCFDSRIKAVRECRGRWQRDRERERQKKTKLSDETKNTAFFLSLTWRVLVAELVPPPRRQVAKLLELTGLASAGEGRRRSSGGRSGRGGSAAAHASFFFSFFCLKKNGSRERASERAREREREDEINHSSFFFHLAFFFLLHSSFPVAKKKLAAMNSSLAMRTRIVASTSRCVPCSKKGGKRKGGKQRDSRANRRTERRKQKEARRLRHFSPLELIIVLFSLFQTLKKPTQDVSFAIRGRPCFCSPGAFHGIEIRKKVEGKIERKEKGIQRDREFEETKKCARVAWRSFRSMCFFSFELKSRDMLPFPTVEFHIQCPLSCLSDVIHDLTHRNFYNVNENPTKKTNKNRLPTLLLRMRLAARRSPPAPLPSPPRSPLPRPRPSSASAERPRTNSTPLTR